MGCSPCCNIAWLLEAGSIGTASCTKPDELKYHINYVTQYTTGGGY